MKNFEPFVDVIITTFNRPGFLEESIESVENQTAFWVYDYIRSYISFDKSSNFSKVVFVKFFLEFTLPTLFYFYIHF